MTPTAPAPFPPHDALVLGAGVAGLSAALQLAEAGHRPLVLEAAPTAGGRLRSFFCPELGEELDCGPHLLVGACQRTLTLLERLGTRALLHAPDRLGLTFWSEDAGWHALACPPLLPAPVHLAAALLGFSPLSWKERIASLRLTPELLRPPPRLEEESVTQWLQRHGQPVALLQRLWNPLCLAILNEPPGSANAALLVNVLREAFFTRREAGRLLLPRVPLNALFIAPALARLTALGGALRCRTRVTALEHDGARLTALVTPQGTLPAPRAVVVALPPAALARLLPEWAAASGFDQLESSPILSVFLRYRSTVRLPEPLVGVPFLTSQWLFDLGALRGRGEGTLLAAVISAAYRESAWPRARLLEEVQRDVARVLPALAGETPMAAVTRRERHATFAPWPGSSARRPGAVTPWSNLLLAGDWSATGLPATVEGAVQSGERAALLAHGLLSCKGGIV